MILRRTPVSVPSALVGAAALLLAAGLPRAAVAAEASAWAKGAQSQARLIAAGAVAARGGLLAGLEIRLEPRFITYWRDPGDAGVPPTVSFAGSTNLKSATLRYPAPLRLDEGGETAFGYTDDVIFPILVEAADPSKPVGLAMTLDYAACHDICLPAHADLRLTFDRSASPDADRVRAALAAVPRGATVGEVGATPAIVAVSAPDADGAFMVRAALPETGGTLFVEAPEGWAYAAGAAAPDGPGHVVFPVKRLDAPKGEAGPAAPLTLTLTSAVGAIEVPVRLDEAARRP